MGGEGVGAQVPRALEGGHSGSGAPPAFTSSLDFEIQCPILAEASNDKRAAIEVNVVRDSIRRVFTLLRDEDRSQSDFLARVAAEVKESVQDEATRHTRQRKNAHDYWQDRGGPEVAATAQSEAIVRKYSTWLAEDLQPWMESIYPVLDERVWIGARDESGGIIDVLLLADAIGLQAYNWNLELDRSPLSRLDIAVAGDPGLVVLADIYAQMLPIRVKHVLA